MFLCGDVMTGRGVDQILPHPGDPRLRERLYRGGAGLRRARGGRQRPDPAPGGPGVAVGRRARGARRRGARRPADQPGDQHHPQRRLRAGQAGALPDEPRQCRLPDRGPADACALANNHVLDFGRTAWRRPWTRWPGPGCGRRGRPGQRRCTAAGGDRPGRRRAHDAVCCGAELVRYPARMGGSRFAARCGPASPPVQAHAAQVAGRAQAGRRPGDLVVVSLHWGSNWGYQVAGLRSPSPAGSSMAGWTWSTATRHTTRARSRCTAASSSCTAAGTSSTTTRASPVEEYRADLRLLYLARSGAAPASSPGCGWCRCRHEPAAAARPATRTGGGWRRRSTGSAAASGRAWSWPPTACSCCTRGRAGG